MSVGGCTGLHEIGSAGRYNCVLFELMLPTKIIEELLNAAFEFLSSH